MTQKTGEQKAFSPDQELGTKTKVWYAIMSIGAVLVQVSWVLSPRQSATSSKGMQRERERSSLSQRTPISY